MSNIDKKYQSLREVHEVTQWKEGCIYKTKSIGFAWVTLDYVPSDNKNIIYGSISSKLSQKLGSKGTFRTVPATTPDVVPTEVTE